MPNFINLVQTVLK